MSGLKEPISPELVLVCPELREELQARDQAAERRRPGDALVPVQPGAGETGAMPAAATAAASGATRRSRRALVGAAALYALSRLLTVTAEALLILAGFVLVLFVLVRLVQS